ARTCCGRLHRPKLKWHAVAILKMTPVSPLDRSGSKPPEDGRGRGPGRAGAADRVCNEACSVKGRQLDDLGPPLCNVARMPRGEANTVIHVMAAACRTL